MLRCSPVRKPRDADSGELPEVTPFADFRDWLRPRRDGSGWQQDEHVTHIGTTGSGKTTMMLNLATIRKYVAVFAPKPSDGTLDGLTRKGWVLTEEWPPPKDARRVIVWPKFSQISDVGRQAQVFGHALESIFRVGGWSVVVDDLPYLVKKLRLGDTLETLYYQARALDISLVGGTQRPRNVPLAALNQATHLFIYRGADRDDVKRVAELGVFSRELLMETIPQLPKYHALYLNTRTGDIRHVVTPAPIATPPRS